jgi:tRNA threonylcarbamoyl adenosine modification protein YeaZ
MLLTIDTCASLCAASVSEAGAELGRCVRDIGTGHAEQLMDVIAAALAAAGSSYDRLTGIAVAVGPGSFTGIRVGVSTARGLALALKVPSVGVGTLDAIAEEARALFPARSIVVAIDARREEVYTAAWDADGTPVAMPAVTSLADAVSLLASLADPVLAGSAAPALVAAAGGAHDVASTMATADIAAYARLADRQGLSGERPKPLYLRAPDAKPQTSFVLPRREGGQ